jgi:hypothetical protein
VALAVQVDVSVPDDHLRATVELAFQFPPATAIVHVAVGLVS